MQNQSIDPPVQNIDLSFSVMHHSGDHTIAYKEVDENPIYLSYFQPPCMKPGRQYPTILMIHGGSWTTHHIFQDQNFWQGDYLGFLARYFSQKGYICVSIDYRLMQDNGQSEHYQLMDLYEDCADAVQYVIDHAAQTQVDVNALMVLGESAGGYLAGALATFHHDRHFPLRGACLVNPITDLVYDSHWQTSVPAYSQHPTIKHLSLEQRRIFLSPAYRIDPQTCPILLLHGEEDTVVSPSHSRNFYEQMTHQNRSCTLHMIKKTNHAFLLAEYTDNLPACIHAIVLIEQWLSSLLV